MIKYNSIGLMGLGSMGKNLAINILKNNYSLSIYNRSKNKLDDFKTNNKNKNFTCFEDIKSFILSLEIPRKIFIIITSGKSIDKLINQFINYLNENDIIIDLSNSSYKDSYRREKLLSNFNIKFLGIGVSGGINGALNGLSMMIGGDKEAFNNIKLILEKISYKKNNKSCLKYLGSNGIGHYIKIIHNSIEYSNMQLISEIYLILKNIFYCDNNEIKEIFYKWNKTILKSYLLKISYNILIKKEENDENKYILDLISDEADNKGTVRSAIKNSIDIGAFSNIPTSALYIRYISSIKNDREEILKILNSENSYKKNINKYKKLIYLKKLEKTLYIGSLFSYIQGIYQIELMSKINNWNINISDIIDVLNFGTIIESKLLEEIYNISNNKNFNYIKIFLYFKKNIKLYIKSLREISLISIKNKIPVLVINSSLMYYDLITSKKLSTNFIQAQRDYFGGHSYKRIDKLGYFNTKWI